MPMKPLLTAALETLSNQFLALDDGSQARRADLAGKILAIELNPFPKLFFVLSEQQLDVLGSYAGEADCYLSLSVFDLPELSQSDNIPQLIKQDKLSLQGEIQLAQRFAELFLECRPDIEEKLSAIVGDAVAHRLCAVVRQLVTGLNQAWQSCPQRLHNVAAEEWRVLPINEEYQHWLQQVNQLKLELIALEQRVEELDKR